MRLSIHALLSLLTLVYVDASNTAPTSGQTNADILQEEEEHSQQQEQSQRQASLLRNFGDDEDRRVWVTYQDGDRNRLFDILRSGPFRSRLREVFEFPRENSFVVEGPRSVIARLQANPAVRLVEEDQKRYPQVLPGSMERRSLQQVSEIPYGISMVQADEAWARGVTGAGAKVCVIDSGIDATHEDFIRANLDGFEGSELDWFEDGGGHGTHVSGTVAAARNGLGVTGVAPDAEIFVVRVFNDDGAFVFSSGLVDAAERCQAAGANIISMSLGGGFPVFAESLGFQRLHDDGMIIIAAAGNGGNRRKSYPASYPDVISVAAIDEDMDRARFSQFNNAVDIAAPGVDVESTFPMDNTCELCENSVEPGYGIISGTSMATPHVSGVAALLWSFMPSASSSEIEEALLSTTLDLGRSGRDNFYGNGLVQALDGLEYLNGNNPLR